jgi:hypothetical protein
MRAHHHHPLTQTVGLVTVYLLMVAVVAALLTRLVFREAARRLLRVHFVAVPHHAGDALGIWLHNATIVLGFAIFLGCAQLAQRAPDAARTEWAILRAGDGAMFIWATWTAVLAGVLAGAYGSVQIRAFLPQGPVEIAAWALLIALYIRVRRQRLAAGTTALLLAVVLVMLALSAVLELWAGA